MKSHHTSITQKTVGLVDEEIGLIEEEIVKLVEEITQESSNRFWTQHGNDGVIPDGVKLLQEVNPALSTKTKIKLFVEIASKRLGYLPSLWSFMNIYRDEVTDKLYNAIVKQDVAALREILEQIRKVTCDADSTSTLDY